LTTGLTEEIVGFTNIVIDQYFSYKINVFELGSSPAFEHYPTGFGHRRSPPKFLKNMVILYFERRFSKQNSVIRLKSNFWPPQKFWAGYATGFGLNFYTCVGVPKTTLCPTPDAIGNGRMSLSAGPIQVGSMLRYTCNNGYRLRGAKVLVCSFGGVWSSSPPTCHGNKDVVLSRDSFKVAPYF